MKVVIAGASGFIGGALLTQCLQNSLITSLTLLSRRPLPVISALDQRIEVIVLEDFASYPESVTEQLSGAKACLWHVNFSQYCSTN
jgi:nucleoside-diphosphate-sugar epimerase